jgi:hypothetical protein
MRMIVITKFIRSIRAVVLLITNSRQSDARTINFAFKLIFGAIIVVFAVEFVLTRGAIVASITYPRL